MGLEDAVTAEDNQSAVEVAQDTSLAAAEKERSRQYSERLANLGAE